MNVSTAWGAAFTEYSGINVRTGASDLTDTDFDNFPPFVRNSFDVANEIQYVPIGDLYYAYLANNDTINLNMPIERSIAYTACKNMSIPINRIWGYSRTPDSSSSQYPELTDPTAILLQSDTTPIPIMLMDTRGIAQARAHGMSASQHYFYNPFYRTSQGIYNKQQLFTQYAANANLSGTEGTPYDNTGRAASNKNLFAAYYRDFGVRSMFLTIYVTYYTSIGSTTETPSGVNNKSLYDYSQQTAEWKEQHPICCAYALVNRRTGITGTYAASDVNITSDLTVNLKSNWSFSSVSIGDMIGQPIANVDTEYLTPALPIFGTMAPHHWITSTVGTSASGGVGQYVGILIGGGTDSPIVHRQGKDGTQYKGTIWCELEGTDENIELIRHWCAAYGLFFTDGASGDAGYSQLYAAGNDETRWTDEKMCLGVIDDEGFTDGTYTRGTGNEDANNFDWKTVSESKYDPIKPPPSPENQYSTETTFNSIGDVATMTKRYVLTGATVKLLAQQLWTITENMINVGGNIDFSELSNKLLDQFLTSNPIDCIVSLQRYPMEIPAVGDTTIVLGKYDTSLHAKPMEKTAYFYLFSGNTINPKFGDSFLDYQPFTKMELYVPFCGTIQINPADILGRKLNVQLVVDFTTGTATGFVMSDNLVIETVNGNVAIDIPVTGIQQTTVASNLYNAIAQRSNTYKQEDITGWNRVSLGGALEIFWGDAMGASETFGVKGKKTLQREIAATNREKADYDLTHQSAPVHIIGSASPAGGWAIDLNCRLLIYYPTGDVIRDANPPAWNNLQLARYGHTTGFACCVEKSIGEMGYGLVVGTAPRLDLMTTNTLHNPATIEELDMIRAAIEEGIILPVVTE